MKLWEVTHFSGDTLTLWTATRKEARETALDWLKNDEHIHQVHLHSYTVDTKLPKAKALLFCLNQQHPPSTERVEEGYWAKSGRWHGAAPE